MPWHSKEQPSPLDAIPISGLQFLHGDVIAQQYRQEWTSGQAYPLITFPSGLTREVLAGSDPAVHIFGTLKLPYHSTRDSAYEASLPVAEEYGYELDKAGERTLTIANPSTGRSYQLRFDNNKRELVDLLHFPEYAMELLDGKSRAMLPPLYSTEKLGEKAIAPVKFFTPDTNWTWWPTEFDGQDLFFGLVSGFVVELGYFSLSELESVRGLLGLPIERDLHFAPTSLEELQRSQR